MPGLPWKMSLVSGNQTCSLPRNGNFKKGFIIWIRESFLQWTGGDYPAVLFDVVQKRLDMLGFKLKFWPEQNFPILQQDPRIILDSEDTGRY